MTKFADVKLAAMRVRKIREAMGMSRPKFADMLGVPPTTLKNYELGYREIGGEFLIRMGHELGGETVLWVMDVARIDESKLEDHGKALVEARVQRNLAKQSPARAQL